MELERGNGSVNGLLGGNPWQGFAHPSHRTDEYEALNKTLRFASIQLNKFWVEVNAFPVFMNELKGASLQEIERLFVWLQTSPSWSERVLLPRLIPDLTRPLLRQALLSFAQDVRVARGLRESLAKLQNAALPDSASLVAAQAHLGTAIGLVRQLGLEGSRPSSVNTRIQEVSERLEANRRVQRFFARLHSEVGIPEALGLSEAGRVFQAADAILRTPAPILGWRKPQILGSQQRIRIEAWQDRTRPVLELRKRLAAQFKLDEPITPEQLRGLGASLKAAGAFRAFNSGYKDSLKQYQALLNSDVSSKGPSRESPVEMAERLAEWAGFLEQKAAFDANAEAVAFFAPHFHGLDTDFAGALAAHAWASSRRGEFKVTDTEAVREIAFCAKLVESIFALPAESLQAWVGLCTGTEAKAVQSILLANQYATGREFSDLACDEEIRLLELTRLRDHLSALWIKADVPLGGLTELRGLTEELTAILKRMESGSDVKASLKNAFAGEGTELSWIEGALSYVEFIEAAGLPESLRNSLLTAHGPQRLFDARSLVAPAMNGLAAVKEHLHRLEVATHGQSRGLETQPLLDLLNRIQRALKQPTSLGEWVDRLRSSQL